MHAHSIRPPGVHNLHDVSQPTPCLYSSYQQRMGWANNNRGGWSCHRVLRETCPRRWTQGCGVQHRSNRNHPCWTWFQLAWRIWPHQGTYQIHSIGYPNNAKRKTNEPQSSSPDTSSSPDPHSPLAPVLVTWPAPRSHRSPYPAPYWTVTFSDTSPSSSTFHLPAHAWISVVNGE